MKRTSLNELHIELGAKMVEFGGWHMPLQYSNITDEHMAVRNSVGIFDVSHMGDLLLGGTDALSLLERLSTRNISKAKVGSARYTHFLDEQGRIIDDMLVTPLGDGRFLVVPNAATKDVVLEWIRGNIRQGESVTIDDLSDSLTCIAVQGPHAADIVQTLVDLDVSTVKRWKAKVASPVWERENGEPSVSTWSTAPEYGDIGKEDRGWVLASRTGYTGEDGFELIMPNSIGPGAWKALLNQGAVPVGLGARDTLRLEKGYLLSGTDFHNDRSTLETGYDWVVDFSKEFVGRDALLRQKEEGYPLLTGFRLVSKGIPRHGFDVLMDGRKVSKVTSGGMSPVLKTGIAMGYMPQDKREPGTLVQLARGHRTLGAEIVKMPFV